MNKNEANAALIENEDIQEAILCLHVNGLIIEGDKLWTLVLAVYGKARDEAIARYTEELSNE